MPFQSDHKVIRWKMHFRSSPERVFEALATDAGRARFWAESAVEVDGSIIFEFTDHPAVHGRIVERLAPSFFAVEYFGALVEFSLADDGDGGTDLSLVTKGVADEERTEVIAGWVSVLLAMKAAVDHEVDLRNHDRSRSWSRGYADN